MQAATITSERDLVAGDVLVSPDGAVRIIRSRTATDDGWNCTDGAPLLDGDANDSSRWTPYQPDELAAALRLAAEVRSISHDPVMSGGLRTWDACSGRPCVLPRLAAAARDNR
ncbi:MAG: hypothetical protein AAFP84_03630 [Actinomycetota bacterium]